MAKGSVIVTHLIEGDPNGIRKVSIKNKTCAMYVIPRTRISDAFAHEYIPLKGQTGLYILLESFNTIDDEKPRAYIGQSDDVVKRITQHLSGKEEKVNFFNYAVIFVSTDSDSGGINKADVLYLEHKAIKAANDANRFEITNTVDGTKPHLSPDQRDVIEEFSEFVWLLISFMGCKIFYKATPQQTFQNPYEGLDFFIRWKGSEARAYFTNDEMVVRKGSELRSETVKSANPARRAKAIAGLFELVDGKCILKEDTPFSSPSRAAWIVSGVSLNGWDAWRTEDGRTLDYIVRQNI